LLDAGTVSTAGNVVRDFLSEQASDARTWPTDEAVLAALPTVKLGNLTLVTQKLNHVLSHRPWTDAEAMIVAPKGKDAGLGKRSLINRYSTLVLNKEIVDDNVVKWSEVDISARGVELSKRVILAWPRASSSP
jgi:hypothetical protein